MKECDNKLNVFNSKELLLEKLNKSLEEELNELKVINVNSELQDQKLKSIEQANRILQDEIHLIKQEKSNEIKALSDENLKLKEQLKEYENYMNNYENEIEVLKELNLKSKELNDKSHHDELELLKLKLNKQESIDKRLFELEEENINLKIQIEDYTKNINDLQEELIDSQLKYTNSQNQVEDLKNKLNSLNDNDVDDFKENLKDSKRQIVALSEQLTSTLTSLQLKEQECKNLEKLYDYEKLRIDSLLNKIEELTQKNTELIFELKETKIKNGEYEIVGFDI